MTIQTDQAGAVSLLMMNIGFEDPESERYQTRLARFERLGVKLFGVANCLIAFGKISAQIDRSETSMVALEANFCDSLVFPSEIQVIEDARLDAACSANPNVVGAPFIRFFASHPIFDVKKNHVGNVVLIDYKVRTLDDEGRLHLADLAHLVERELVMSLMYQAQQDLIKQNRNLKRESLIDPALGTWNKAAINRSLQIETERCTKAEKPLSLMFAGVDQIDEIRSKHGIASSDMVMLKVVSRIRSCIRPFDALGRFGNDIFLMVLPGASNLVATAVAERIRLAVLANPDQIDGESVQISISAGIISTDLFAGVDSESLIHLVEKAYLAAKKEGGNCIMKASPDQLFVIE